MKLWVAKALASGFFLSYLPARLFKTRIGSGAGVIGTLWGVAALPLMPPSPIPQAAVWAAVLALSVAVSDIAEEGFGGKDDARIVIDETAGYLTTMLFLPHSWPMVVMGFFLFRLLDIWKPGPIRRAANLPGGWGVVMDDICAGAVGNVILQVVNVVHPF